MSIFKKFKQLFSKNNCTIVPEVYKSGAAKYSLTADCTLELSSGTMLKKKEIDAHLNQLVKKYINSPEKLLQYLKLKGIDVFEIKNAEKLLSFFKEEEGFNPPSKGFKAAVFYAVLSYLSSGKLKIRFFSVPEFIVFDLENKDIYKIARALYKYCSFKNNLSGYDFYSQMIFKKIYGAKKPEYKNALIENASVKDILACRNALARDLDSINFTLQLSLEYERSKKALKKILKDKNAKI